MNYGLCIVTILLWPRTNFVSSGFSIFTVFSCIANSLVACGHFSNNSSMTTGVLAWMLCLSPAGMWTQVAGFAS
jgi:hypothetical protein